VGFAVMTNLSAYYKQERIARDHLQNIIYALIVLKVAKTGKITKFVNDKARSEVGGIYESSKRIELKDRQIDRKTVQKWLSRLEKDGMVSKTNYYVYSLTNSGRAIKIFAESYGKSLFDQLVKIPLKGTKDEKLLACINRLGLYIVYIFIRNSAPTVGSALHAAIEENDVEWMNEAINLKLMFEWFTRKFYTKKQKNSSRYQNFYTLMYTLERQFSEYLPILLKSEQDYYKKLFPDYYREVILKKIRK
jgi:hypothetical protein